MMADTTSDGFTGGAAVVVGDSTAVVVIVVATVVVCGSVVSELKAVEKFSD